MAEIEPKFRVGETVRVRQWEDMEAEFGLNSYGSISVPYHFIDEMRFFCGEEAEVKKCVKDNERDGNVFRY